MKIRERRWLSLLLLGAVSCSDGSSQDEPEAVSSDQEELAQSTTLPAALSGKIQQIVGAPNNLISASTKGTPSVGDDGASNYSIPIWVPDGINGLQPELAVEYNSESGHGLLGPHWSLSGLSVITRCAKTRAKDGVQGGIDYFGSTFCLDGQPLVMLSSTSTEAEFRTEQDSFRKIVGTKNSLGDFTSFKVYQPDGRIYSYGTTLNSRLHGNPVLLAGGTARDAAYAFHVDKIADRYSNSINITYLNASSATTGKSLVQELVPNTIKWGNSSQLRSVSFAYEALPGGASVNPETRFIRGLQIGRGQYLKSMTISGPNGAGSSSVSTLKVYKFSYDTASAPGSPAVITGRRVLSSISECDAFGVCKKPTTITWEAGSLTYTRTPLGIPNFHAPNQIGFPKSVTGTPTPTTYDKYARFLVADMNRDGRDDIIYRGFISPHHSDGQDCTGWLVSLATVTPSGSTYGAGVPLTALGGDPDWTCRAGVISPTHFKDWAAPDTTLTGGTGYEGDIIITDLTGDGYADIISPIGKVSLTPTSRVSNVYGYRAYLNTMTPGGALTFSPPINFLASAASGVRPNGVNLSQPGGWGVEPLGNAMIAVADIDGNGIPEVFEQSRLIPKVLEFTSISTSGLTQNVDSINGQQFPFYSINTGGTLPSVKFTDGSQTFSDVTTIDLDGDGSAEVLRQWSAGAQDIVDVASPTLNGLITGVPPKKKSRVLLDLNGDGLTDLLFPAGPNPEGDTGWGFTVRLGNGQGFDTAKSVSWASSTSCRAWGDTMRVLDYNLDGRDDVLVEAFLKAGRIDANLSCKTGADRHMWLLVSDGAGGLVAQNPGPLPLGMNLTATAVDLNADGMTDFLQDENSEAVAYIRDGKAPEMVTAITEGTGLSIAFNYLAANGGDKSFYDIQSDQTCDKDPQRLECLTRGRWLTQSLTIATPDTYFEQSFTYAGGVSDKNGRGFLGFRRRDVYGPGSQHTTLGYEPTLRKQLNNGGGYVYGSALQPLSIRTEVEMSDASNPHRTEIRTFARPVIDGFNKTFTLQLLQVDHSIKDCLSADASGTCPTSGGRNMGSRTETFKYDSYGNLTQRISRFRDGTPSELIAETENNYFAPDINNWLLNLPDPTRPNTLNSSTTSPAESVTRTVKLTADLATGALSTIEIEPNGDTSVHSKRTFGYNSKGQITSIKEEDFAGSPARTTQFLYEDADGVYVTTTIDPLLFKTRVWRHPGLGLVVETDDENGLASTFSYDTFGRPRLRVGEAGASTRVDYSDGPGNGADLEVFPEGAGGKIVKIHLDEFEREVRRQTPTSDSNQLLTERYFDERGRVYYHHESSVSGGNTTELSSEYLYYDDLDRLMYAAKSSASGGYAWRFINRDGFTLTKTDEAGRAITTINDALGRRVVQRAELETGTSDSTFTYGAFGLLEREAISDASGGTTLTYDVLGRQLTVARSRAGVRVSKYNAFGEQTSAYKLSSDGIVVDNLTFTRDQLGRITSVTGSGMNRTFSWDAPASNPTVPAPYAKGKLVDVKDGNATQIHYDYGSNGLVSKKTWSAAVGGSLAEVGSAGYSYDSMGRIQRLTYPRVASWSNPLVIRYDYDWVTGEASTLTDESSPGAPVWTATGRNERGRVVNESMQAASGPKITRNTKYNSATGELETSTLTGSNGSVSARYVHDAAGLPTEFHMTGVGGTWDTTYGYDNLSRLTHWSPARCCGGSPIDVKYSYDGDGNMTRREWSWMSNYGLIEYAVAPSRIGDNIITVRSSGNSFPTTTDWYRSDAYGRLYQTPAVALAYNAADEVTSVTEVPGGQVNTIYRDGFGGRLATKYGDPASGGSVLYTFDDLAEIRASSLAIEERCQLRANGALVGELVRTTDTPTRSGTFLLTDKVGSVIAEGASYGTVTARAPRDPFGNRLADPLFPYLPGDPAGANNDGSGRLAYAGHARDNKWGLVDMGARFYSPRLGRFATPDPLISDALERRAHNAFAYVWNNPAAMWDPDGRESQPCNGAGCTGGGDPPPGDGPCGPSGCWESTKHFVGAGYRHAKSGVKTAWHWVTGLFDSDDPGPPPVIIITPNNVVYSPPTSVNATNTVGTNYGKNGTTETNRDSKPLKAPDIRDDALDAIGKTIGNIAENTNVRLTMPGSFGPLKLVNYPQSYNLTLHELGTNSLLENLGSRWVIGGYKLDALRLLKGIDESIPTVSAGLNWADAIDAHQIGDHGTEGRFWLEGSFGLAAAKAGPLGVMMSFAWLEMKLSLWNVQNNMERARQGRDPIFYPSYPLAAPWAPTNP